MNNTLSPPPQNIEAEQCVLGAILINGEVLDKVLSILTKEDLYKEAHKKIFEAMVSMNKENKPIDVFTVFDYTKSKGNLLGDAGGSSYLAYLTELVSSTANVEYYAKLVKEKSKSRRLLIKLNEFESKIQAGRTSPDEVIQQIREDLNKIDTDIDSTLKPISIKNLDDAEPVESLYGDILYPSCITQVNSEPGVGKTTFFYNLCLYGVSGRDFLGIVFSKKLKVLYVDVETPTWKRKQKLRAVYGEELPDNFFFLDSLNLRNDFSYLLALCKKEKYDLIVLDTQSRILAMEQENDNSEANFCMALLRQLANESGAAIVLIHHTTKSEHKGVYSGRGASAIAAAVDVVVNMELLDEEVIKLQVAKNRIVGDYPNLFIRKVGEDRFETCIPPDGNSSGFEKFKAQDFILSLAHDRQWKTSDLKTHGGQKGFSESNIKRAISGLVQTGKLRKVGHGLYEISDKRSKGQKFTPREEKVEHLNFSDVTLDNEMDFPEYLK